MNTIESLNYTHDDFNITIKINNVGKDVSMFDKIFELYEKYYHDTKKSLKFVDDNILSIITINLHYKRITFGRQFQTEYMQYFCNILKKNNINLLNMRYGYVNQNHLVNINLLSPNIKKLSLNFNVNQLSNSHETYWNNTNIKFIDFWGISTHDDILKWLKIHSDIYSLDISDNYIFTVLEFIQTTPNNSLLYVYSEHKKVSCNKLNQLLKNKRILVNNKILMILLIIKYGHKYKKYIPNPIMKLILRYIYDIDYMMIHNMLI